MKIKTRLALSNAAMTILPIAAIIFITSFVLIFFAENYARRTGHRPADIGFFELQEIAGVLVNELDSPGGKVSPETAARLERIFSGAGAAVEISVRGEVVLSRGDAASLEPRVPKGLEKYGDSRLVVFSGREGSFIRARLQLQSGGEMQMLGVTSGGAMASNFVIRVDAAENAKRFLGEFMWIIGLAALAVIMLTNGVLIAVVYRSIAGPLDRLREAANNIKNGNLDFEIYRGGRDELGQLCRDFDDMRLQLRQTLEKRQEYEESRKLVIAGISHDLRTPLTSIKGYISGLMDGIASTPDMQARYLKTLYGTAEDMEKLVDELSLFSTLDCGSAPFSFERVDIGGYFSDCAGDLAFEFAKDGLSVEFLCRLEEPVDVMLDRDKFRRVVLNIAQNSAKYKKGDTGALTITLSSSGHSVLIEFADDGLGVEEEETERIFDNFYRTDEARSNPGRSSGLGLAIARQIVEKHGGRIYAVSRSGEGMRIFIGLTACRIVDVRE